MITSYFMAGMAAGLLLTAGWLFIAVAHMNHDAVMFMANDAKLRRLFT